MGKPQPINQQQRKLKRPKEDDNSYQLGDHDDSDQEIEDDGEQSSEHSSIDLQQYLKNRDNIPSEPSDLQDDSDAEQEQEDDGEDQSQEKDQQYQPSKKQKLDLKKQQKQKPAPRPKKLNSNLGQDE